MAYGRPHIFIETFDGSLLLVGREHGGEVTGGTAVTGTAMGDMNGYTLTFTANEITMPNFVTGATAADPFAGMVSATDTASTQRSA